jgi:hypothetical protein
MCQQRVSLLLRSLFEPEDGGSTFHRNIVNFIEMRSSTSQIIPLQEPQVQPDYKLQVKWGMKIIKIILVWDVTQCFEASLQCYGETSCCCLRGKKLTLNFS